MVSHSRPWPQEFHFQSLALPRLNLAGQQPVPGGSHSLPMPTVNSLDSLGPLAADSRARCSRAMGTCGSAGANGVAGSSAGASENKAQHV